LEVEKLKLQPGGKVLFVTIGIVFAWFGLYIMLTDFYEGIIEVTVSAIEGGEYHPFYLRGFGMILWLACIVISSICLAIGLRAEEL